MKYIKFFENYKEVDNFKLLSEIILKTFLKEYRMSFKRFQKTLNYSEFKGVSLYGDMLDIDILKNDRNTNLYSFLRSKFFRDLEIKLILPQDNSEGSYNTNRNILNISTYYMDEVIKDEDIFSNEFLIKLYNKFSHIIIHELTHIYDFYMLDGNLFTSKDLKRHKKRITNLNNIDNILTADNDYYNSSFEIKSHLNEIIFELGDISVYKTFQDLLDKINSIERLNSFYNNLETKNKQKINKILFKLWSSQKE
jgi:hypothetical protein